MTETLDKLKYIYFKNINNHILAPLSYTNKTDRHDITEILLKVALNTITLTLALSTYANSFSK